MYAAAPGPECLDSHGQQREAICWSSSCFDHESGCLAQVAEFEQGGEPGRSLSRAGAARCVVHPEHVELTPVRPAPIWWPSPNALGLRSPIILPSERVNRRAIEMAEVVEAPHQQELQPHAISGGSSQIRRSGSGGRANSAFEQGS